MTGSALADRLRKAQPGLPVVFMSGYTARTIEFAIGPRDRLVHKPLTPSEIGRVIHEVLNRV